MKVGDLVFRIKKCPVTRLWYVMGKRYKVKKTSISSNSVQIIVLGGRRIQYAIDSHLFTDKKKAETACEVKNQQPKQKQPTPPTPNEELKSDYLKLLAENRALKDSINELIAKDIERWAMQLIHRLMKHLPDKGISYKTATLDEMIESMKHCLNSPNTDNIDFALMSLMVFDAKKREAR